MFRFWPRTARKVDWQIELWRSVGFKWRKNFLIKDIKDTVLHVYAKQDDWSSKWYWRWPEDFYNLTKDEGVMVKRAKVLPNSLPTRTDWRRTDRPSNRGASLLKDLSETKTNSESYRVYRAPEHVIVFCIYNEYKYSMSYYNWFLPGPAIQMQPHGLWPSLLQFFHLQTGFCNRVNPAARLHIESWQVII